MFINSQHSLWSVTVLSLPVAKGVCVWFLYPALLIANTQLINCKAHLPL